MTVAVYPNSGTGSFTSSLKIKSFLVWPNTSITETEVMLHLGSIVNMQQALKQA